MNRRYLVILTAIGGALMVAVAQAQKPPTQVDVAGMQPGTAPPGFTFWRTGSGAAAEWRVVADPTAVGQKAIAQTSKDTTDYRFPLAVYQPVSARNVDVVLRFKPVGGTVDQAGGIAVRLTTPDDYYVVRANALEDNVRFYRVVKGRREQLKGANTKVATGQWHTLGLHAHFVESVNDALRDGVVTASRAQGRLAAAIVNDTEPQTVGLWRRSRSWSGFRGRSGCWSRSRRGRNRTVYRPEGDTKRGSSYAFALTFTAWDRREGMRTHSRLPGPYGSPVWPRVFISGGHVRLVILRSKISTVQFENYAGNA